jgi:hypothetical protein
MSDSNKNTAWHDLQQYILSILSAWRMYLPFVGNTSINRPCVRNGRFFRKLFVVYDLYFEYSHAPPATAITRITIAAMTGASSWIKKPAIAKKYYQHYYAHYNGCYRSKDHASFGAKQ